MTTDVPSAISLALACIFLVGSSAGCAGTSAGPDAATPSAAAPPQPAPAPVVALPTAADIPALRAEGPAALARLLALHDTISADTTRARLADVIDAVAGQRYATVSRLYWYTDLTAAIDAARASDRPILSLRMLGRLDQDLSCANSRLFRVVLYADRALSAYLRDHFILHWSAERPVPRVTIDYGDGRRLERTIAGNSAHYILDPDGNPVDVLPGLYGAAAFRRELEAAAPVALALRGRTGDARRDALAVHHRARLAAAASLWQTANGTITLPAPAATLTSAEAITISKAIIERPMVQTVRLGPQGAELPDDALAWQALGSRRAEDARLDDQSRALIAALQPSDWAASAGPADPAALATLIAALEQQIAADTALDELKLRWQIHSWFADRAAPDTFAALNRRIYDELFLTPAHDPWLGMATPGIFTGLPADGIVAR
jgi:hypothetical protein